MLKAFGIINSENIYQFCGGIKRGCWRSVNYLQKCIEKSMNGLLFIDEAHKLGIELGDTMI